MTARLSRRSTNSGFIRLDEVLERVRPGRTHAKLQLSPSLARELNSRDGILTRRLLTALVRARLDASASRELALLFPCTEEALYRTARRLGLRVGQKHARELIRIGIGSGLLIPAGDYPSRRGYRVKLYRLGCRVSTRRGAQSQSAVGKNPVVKPAPAARDHRWWEHALFGTPDRRPPPELRGPSRQARLRRKWRSADERLRFVIE